MNSQLFYLKTVGDRLPREIVTAPVMPLSASSVLAVEQAMATSLYALFRVNGDCMEAAGIADGGFVAVDFTRFPRRSEKGFPGDPCLCLATFPGTKRATVMCKAYTGVWGPWKMVATQYHQTEDDVRMNVGMPAERIFGVIFASWGSNGELQWRREPEDFPDKLDLTTAIRSREVGPPIPLGKNGLVFA